MLLYDMHIWGGGVFFLVFTLQISGMSSLVFPVLVAMGVPRRAQILYFLSYSMYLLPQTGLCLKWGSYFLFWKSSRPGDSACYAAAKMAMLAFGSANLRGQSPVLTLSQLCCWMSIVTSAW